MCDSSFKEVTALKESFDQKGTNDIFSLDDDIKASDTTWRSRYRYWEPPHVLICRRQTRRFAASATPTAKTLIFNTY